MKKRLAIAAGIFSFLAALAVLGFLRLGQRQETGRAPMATATEPRVHADAKTTAASPRAEKREELERAELEKARKENELLMARREAEKQASEAQASSKQPPGSGAAPPPVSKPMPRTVPISPSNASSSDLSILDRKSGGGITAPSPSSSAVGRSRCGLEETRLGPDGVRCPGETAAGTNRAHPFVHQSGADGGAIDRRHSRTNQRAGENHCALPA